jgi:hypothetical protein
MLICAVFWFELKAHQQAHGPTMQLLEQRQRRTIKQAG